MQIMHQGAAKGGIGPCLVRPLARPVLVLLQHARVAAFPGSAMLGTAVNRDCNGAARARDGRLQPAPAMGAAQARERRPRPGTALLGKLQCAPAIDASRALQRVFFVRATAQKTAPKPDLPR